MPELVRLCVGGQAVIEDVWQRLLLAAAAAVSTRPVVPVQGDEGEAGTVDKPPLREPREATIIHVV